MKTLYTLIIAIVFLYTICKNTEPVDSNITYDEAVSY